MKRGSVPAPRASTWQSSRRASAENFRSSDGVSGRAYAVGPTNSTRGINALTPGAWFPRIDGIVAGRLYNLAVAPAGTRKTALVRRWHRSVAWIDAHPTAAVFGVALALRLACVAWLRSEPYAQGGDAPHYLAIARDILTGQPYGYDIHDTIRVPLYEAFLAAHLWAFGGRLILVAVSQAVVGAATAVMMTWTAEELIPGPHCWAAGLLWATYPPSILNTVVVFPQTLQVFWLVAAFWLLIGGIRSRSTGRCAAAAVLWSAGCLTRAGNLFFLPVFAAAPVLCWHLRASGALRWAAAASGVMLVLGTLSMVWWTARDFPKTYRLEDLVLDPRERSGVALLLAPTQPIPDRIAGWLRSWAQGAPSPSVSGPPAPTAVVPKIDVGVAARDWRFELNRTRTKLWQTFSAPDGCVQLGCTGPPGGYWAAFRAQGTTHPLWIAVQAFSRPCMVLKSLMYVQHYLLLLLTIPAFVMLARRFPGVALLLSCYGVYTVVIIVLGPNYSRTEIAAVPRFAFSLMPVPVLLVGLLGSEALSGIALRRMLSPPAA